MLQVGVRLRLMNGILHSPLATHLFELVLSVYNLDKSPQQTCETVYGRDTASRVLASNTGHLVGAWQYQ